MRFGPLRIGGAKIQTETLPGSGLDCDCAGQTSRPERPTFATAIVDLNKAIRLNPQLAEAYSRSGYAHGKSEFFPSIKRGPDPDFAPLHFALHLYGSLGHRVWGVGASGEPGRNESQLQWDRGSGAEIPRSGRIFWSSDGFIPCRADFAAHGPRRDRRGAQEEARLERRIGEGRGPRARLPH